MEAGGIHGGCRRQKGIYELQLRSSSPASGVNWYPDNKAIYTTVMGRGGEA